MAIALGLARRSLGSTWPNPAVGCVLVCDDDAGPIIIGRGWTARGGRPHAETQALKRAGRRASGSTAYVTLEPCSHHGQTPPCSEALIKARIARVVVAIEDPDPRVSGAGIQALLDAGISVTRGVLADQAAELNEGFLLRTKEGRPLVTLKLATTLDGRIASATGDSKWITGERARSFAHQLRASSDAIVVGIGTMLADDPALTCRLSGMSESSPVRVVFDSALRTPLDYRLVETADETRTIVLTLNGADAVRRRSLVDKGVEVIDVALANDGRVDVSAALQTLAGLGMTRVLCEGGGGLAASLLRADLVDRIAWFRAPSLIGDDGLSSVGALGVVRLDDAPVFVRSALARAGEDTLETYRRPA